MMVPSFLLSPPMPYVRAIITRQCFPCELRLWKEKGIRCGQRWPEATAGGGAKRPRARRHACGLPGFSGGYRGRYCIPKTYPLNVAAEINAVGSIDRTAINPDFALRAAALQAQSPSSVPPHIRDSPTPSLRTTVLRLEQGPSLHKEDGSEQNKRIRNDSSYRCQQSNGLSCGPTVP